MTDSAQLTLNLPHRAAYGRRDFLVAPSNRDAVGWVDKWPEWPGIGLVLYGPEGAGKTHLAHVWKERIDAQDIALKDLAAESPDRLAGHGALILDVGDATALPETELFHVYNCLKDTGGYLLITSRQPPSRWNLQLNDLASRLRSLPAVMLDMPDEDLFAAILSKLFADRQIIVDGDVISYLLVRIERSYAVANRTVAALDAAAMAARRAVTVPFTRNVLADQPDLAVSPDLEDEKPGAAGNEQTGN